jgi:hypothetical protein
MSKLPEDAEPVTQKLIEVPAIRAERSLDVRATPQVEL